MKKKSKHSDKSRSSSRLTSQTAQRLASYSMAAGLGAFGCGEAAHAAIVYTDVEDIVLERYDATVQLNLDNDPMGKLDVQFSNDGGGAWYGSARFVGLPLPGDPVPTSYSYALTRVNAAFPNDPNHAYYIRSFHPNEQIGPVDDVFTFKAGRGTNSPQYGNGVLQTGLRSQFATVVDDFGSLTTDEFAGIAIRDPNDGLHFGWVRLRAEIMMVEEAPYYSLKWTLYDWAYETELNTPILAGAKPAAVPGDYNGNGEVDAADYTIWRDQLGQSTTLPNSDPTDTDNEVTQAEFNFWKSQFGLGGAGGSGTALDGANVPEPTSLALLAAGFGAFVSRRRR